MSDEQPNTPEPGQEETPKKGPYDGLSAEQLLKLLTEKETKLSEVNHESASRRKKLDELEKARAEQEREKMDELTRTKTDLEKAQAELTRLKGDYAQLLKRNTFDKTVQAMKLAFVNDEARADALERVEAAELGDDLEAGIKKALETLTKERKHWFETANPPESDAIQKGRQTNSPALPSQIVEQKRSTYTPL